MNKIQGKIFLWVQLTHEYLTQQTNYTTKLSQINISQTMVPNNLSVTELYGSDMVNCYLATESYRYQEQLDCVNHTRKF